MVQVDERDVVQSLLDEMAGVIIDIAARMIADCVEELLERLAVENLLAGVQLKPKVDAGFVEGVEDGRPTPGELGESRFDEMARALRPGIDIRPGERTAERLRDLEAQALRRDGGDLHLLDRPGLTRFGIPVHARRRESVIDGVVSRMHGDKLALKGGHQFGGLEAVLFQCPRDLVGIGLAFGATAEVEEAARPSSGAAAPCSRDSPPTWRSPGRLLNGGRSLASCAMSSAGPLIVRIGNPSFISVPSSLSRLARSRSDGGQSSGRISVTSASKCSGGRQLAPLPRPTGTCKEADKALYTNRAEVHAPLLRLEATDASTKATPRAPSAHGRRQRDRRGWRPPARRAAISSAASR